MKLDKYLLSSKAKLTPNFKDGRCLKDYYCIDCGKKISMKSGFFGYSRCKKCANIKAGKNHRGKNGKNYKHGKCLKKYCCIDCNKEISISSGIYGQCRCQPCANKYSYKIGKINKKGSHNSNWQGGIGKEPYPFKFSRQLKEQIRKRDNYQCQICGKSTKKNGRRLDIHHIDYDKNNLKPSNLITLCKSCHMKTNGNRNIYIEYFKILREIVK